jgi:hypothetical protein
MPDCGFDTIGGTPTTWLLSLDREGREDRVGKQNPQHRAHDQKGRSNGLAMRDDEELRADETEPATTVK